MKERPILFSAPMVLATLDDRKTQTRRVMKPQPLFTSDGKDVAWWQRQGKNRRGLRLYEGGADPTSRFKELVTAFCPYGAVGDRLWVREAWRVTKNFDVRPPRDIPRRKCTVIYLAGGSSANYEDGWHEDREGWPVAGAKLPNWLGRYRHARFMPRWASRITLEITGVRVERVQRISYEDACVEGCALPEMRFEPIGDGETWEQTARRLRWPQRSFEQLWSSINGADSWAANPWVWVIEFRRFASEVRLAA